MAEDLRWMVHRKNLDYRLNDMVMAVAHGGRQRLIK